jgi:hypothetical protein
MACFLTFNDTGIGLDQENNVQGSFALQSAITLGNPTNKVELACFASGNGVAISTSGLTVVPVGQLQAVY